MLNFVSSNSLFFFSCMSNIEVTLKISIMDLISAESIGF